MVSSQGGSVELEEYCCPDCGTYIESGSWCDPCLDKVDLDEHEERKRKRLFEEQEY